MKRATQTPITENMVIYLMATDSKFVVKSIRDLLKKKHGNSDDLMQAVDEWTEDWEAWQAVAESRLSKREAKEADIIGAAIAFKKCLYDLNRWEKKIERIEALKASKEFE